MAVAPSASGSDRAWPKWVIVFLAIISVPLILVGLKISLSFGESVYEFGREFGTKLTGWQKEVFVVCRVAAWMMPLFSSIQSVLIGHAIWRGMRSQKSNVQTNSVSRKRTTIALAVGIVVLLALEMLWISQMVPTVQLMQAVHWSRV